MNAGEALLFGLTIGLVAGAAFGFGLGALFADRTGRKASEDRARAERIQRDEYRAAADAHQ